MQIYCVDPLPATKLPTQICMLTDFLFYVFPNRTFVRQTCAGDVVMNPSGISSA